LFDNQGLLYETFEIVLAAGSIDGDVPFRVLFGEGRAGVQRGGILRSCHRKKYIQPSSCQEYRNSLGFFLGYSKGDSRTLYPLGLSF
jgi:hypothetical protein